MDRYHYIAIPQWPRLMRARLVGAKPGHKRQPRIPGFRALQLSLSETPYLLLQVTIVALRAIELLSSNIIDYLLLH